MCVLHVRFCFSHLFLFRVIIIIFLFFFCFVFPCFPLFSFFSRPSGPPKPLKKSRKVLIVKITSFPPVKIRFLGVGGLRGGVGNGPI